MELRMKGTRGPAVTIGVDGRMLQACAGESLAAALLAAGVLHLRDSPRAGRPRGALCFMGVCQECVVQVDGITAQACLTEVRDGMSVVLAGPYAA